MIPRSLLPVIPHQLDLPYLRRLGDSPLPEVVVELHGPGAEGGEGFVSGLAGAVSATDTHFAQIRLAPRRGPGRRPREESPGARPPRQGL